jgi:hypothetical protein
MQAKDYPNLIQAFRLLLNTQSKAQLLIVGDGVQRAELEQQVQQFELTNQIRFWACGMMLRNYCQPQICLSCPRLGKDLVWWWQKP